MPLVFPVGYPSLLIGKNEPGFLFGCPLPEDGGRFRIVLAHYHGDAFFYDACFFKCDGGQCVPEELHVVITDIGDDGKVRGNDVGAVETSAKTDLYDGDVAFFLYEVIKRHYDGDLEERGIYLFGYRLDAPDEISDKC